METVIGDRAYSSKENIDAAKEGDYELVARLNSIVTQGNHTKPDEFEFNKDAGMYQCKAGHLAVHKYFDKRKTVGKNPRMTYFFDISAGHGGFRWCRAHLPYRAAGQTDYCVGFSFPVAGV